MAADLTKDVRTESHKLALAASQANIPTDWDSLRDFVDQRTGGDLDCIQIDIMTDSVRAHLVPREAWGPKTDRKPA